MEEKESGRSALLVVDVQQGLFERSKPVYQADQLLANINGLADQARERGAPVVFIQHSNDKTLRSGTREWAFHPEINPQLGDLHIHKRHGNAFQETSLHQELQNRNISRIFVTGLVTQGCVRATCLGGLDLGYEVVLVSNAHSTYSKPAAKIIARWQDELMKSGALLKVTKEVLF
ncbi:MAG: isochorismatase family cysteine hydrolase [Anaerolineales bacterium]|jgi:nicotinamidase-related amidase